MASNRPTRPTTLRDRATAPNALPHADNHGPGAGDGTGLSAHRLEALTDGIYAVAMTLLVIELKLPSMPHGADDGAIQQALLELLPKVAAWLMSFLVLAVFWFSKLRAFHRLRHLTGRLVTLNVLQLALVSLMPFSCALIGEHGQALVSQVVYSANMVALALLGLLISGYIYRHPTLCATPMALAAHRGAQVRLVGLIALSLLAVALHPLLPGAGNMAFALMGVVMPLSRWIENRRAAMH